MDTMPSSEGGASRGESSGAVGGASQGNESFHEIPEERIPRHELLLLLRIEQENGRPLPMGTHSKHCVNLQIVQWTGITAVRTIRMNPFDTGGVCCRCSNCGSSTTTPHGEGVGRDPGDCFLHHGKEGVYYGCMQTEIHYDQTTGTG